MPKRRPKSQSLESLLFNAIVAFAVLALFYIIVTGVLSAIVYLFYHAGYIGYNNFNYLIYAVSLLAMSASIFLYLMTYKKLKTVKIPGSLGFGLKNFSLKYVGIGVLIFGIILCIELVVSLLSAITGVAINTNTAVLFSGAPIWFFIFAAVIEPINEEIVFRGFLVPRLGIIPSALLFGFAHYTYNSTFGIEVIAALIFGLISGYIYKKTGSIYPGIVAHILVNSIAALSMLPS